MSSSSGGSNAVDRTDTTTIKTPSAQELAIRELFKGLNDQQVKALTNELSRQASTESPLALNLQDQQTLDAAFNASRERFNLESKDYADYLSGGRGLRMSDTPISQQALDRQGLGLADIESQRANAGLTFGLEANRYRTNAALGLAGAVPGAGAFNLSQYLQERIAQPTTRSTGFGSSSGYQTPSGLMTAAQLAGGLGSLGLGAAAAGGLFAGGSAATTAGTLGIAGLGLA